MSNATITFDLPKERCEHIIAVHAMDWALTCYDLDKFMRDFVKYGAAEHFHVEGVKDDDVRCVLDKMRDKLREILEDRQLSMDMIE